jgi:RNA polymerase sigma factor (sigma-70 family)
MDARELVDAMRKGDERAWREAMRAHGRLVMLAAARVGIGEADRDEVFQTAFLAAFRKIEALRDPERLPAWLYSIAYRLALRMARRAKDEIPLDEIAATDAGDLVAAGESPAAAVERLQEIEIVREALRGLDERCRGLLSALYFEEPRPGYTAIGTRLGMAVGSIGPTRARCLEKLEKVMDRVSNAHQSGSTARKQERNAANEAWRRSNGDDKRTR